MISNHNGVNAGATMSTLEDVVQVLVVAGIVRVWLSRVRELGGLIGASQCRVIAENGLDLTSIC